MKKILLIGTLLLVGLQSYGAVLSTNILSAGAYLLTTNRASIYSVELYSTQAQTVKLFDQNTLASPYYGTNYATAAFPVRTVYSTNYITSYVGYNGYTNWYTNAGIFSITTTNSGVTNELSSQAFIVPASAYAVYNTDILCAKGIVLLTTTNVSVVINYRTGQ